jgi:ATP dependent DNA ligase C terminal region
MRCIGGYTDPAGSRTDFGALLVGYYEQGRLRYAGKVGTGYSVATLRELGARLRTLETPESPFVDARPIPRGTHWTRPELVAQIGMAALVDSDPRLDPDVLFDGRPSDLRGALVLQVVGRQLSRAAATAIVSRLEDLHDGRLPTPSEPLATDEATLRTIGLSRAKSVYLHDLAARLGDGRLDLERLRTLDDDAARAELIQVKGVGRFTADGALMLALRRPDAWPAADLRSLR